MDINAIVVILTAIATYIITRLLKRHEILIKKYEDTFIYILEIDNLLTDIYAEIRPIDRSDDQLVKEHISFMEEKSDEIDEISRKVEANYLLFLRLDYPGKTPSDLANELTIWLSKYYETILKSSEEDYEERIEAVIKEYKDDITDDYLSLTLGLEEQLAKKIRFHL